MITGPVPNQDKLLARIKILQVLDEGNGISLIPSIVGHENKIAIIEIQRSIIRLSLLDVLNRNFRFFVAPAPHISGRVAPQQVALILSKNNDFTFFYRGLMDLQFFLISSCFSNTRSSFFFGFIA